MTAEIIDFGRIAGRISPAMHNRRVQRPDEPESLTEWCRAREPESLTQGEQATVLEFVRAFQPDAIARWIMGNATDAGLATLLGCAAAEPAQGPYPAQ